MFCDSFILRVTYLCLWLFGLVMMLLCDLFNCGCFPVLLYDVIVISCEVYWFASIACVILNWFYIVALYDDLLGGFDCLFVCFIYVCGNCSFLVGFLWFVDLCLDYVWLCERLVGFWVFWFGLVQFKCLFVDGLVNFCLLASICCFVVRSLVCCGDFCLVVCLIAFGVFGFVWCWFWYFGFGFYDFLGFVVWFSLFLFACVWVLFWWFMIDFGLWFLAILIVGLAMVGKLVEMLVFEISWPGCFLWFGFSVVWVKLVWSVELDGWLFCVLDWFMLILFVLVVDLGFGLG